MEVDPTVDDLTVVADGDEDMATDPDVAMGVDDEERGEVEPDHLDTDMTPAPPLPPTPAPLPIHEDREEARAMVAMPHPSPVVAPGASTSAPEAFREAPGTAAESDEDDNRGTTTVAGPPPVALGSAQGPSTTGPSPPPDIRALVRQIQGNMLGWLRTQHIPPNDPGVLDLSRQIDQLNWTWHALVARQGAAFQEAIRDANLIAIIQVLIARRWRNQPDARAFIGRLDMLQRNICVWHWSPRPVAIPE